MIEPGKPARSIFRTVGNNSSFGGNSLVQSIGLGDANLVDVLEIRWPVSETVQRFYHVAGAQSIVITEGSSTWESLDTRHPQPGIENQ